MVMEIIHSRPPIYDKIIAAGMKPSDTVVYAVGHKLFNPSGANVSIDILKHEETHEVQQGDNPDAWWTKYLIDPEFRVSQEAEAYGAQYAFICQQTRDREKRHKVLMELAYILSGDIYGRVIKHMEAYALIKKLSKT